MTEHDKKRDELAEGFSEYWEQYYIDYGKRPTVVDIFKAGYDSRNAEIDRLNAELARVINLDNGIMRTKNAEVEDLKATQDKLVEVLRFSHEHACNASQTAWDSDRELVRGLCGEIKRKCREALAQATKGEK